MLRVIHGFNKEQVSFIKQKRGHTCQEVERKFDMQVSFHGNQLKLVGKQVGQAAGIASLLLKAHC